MECAAGDAHDAVLQPSDTTELAGLGGVQGGIVVPFCVGHPVHDAQNTSCEFVLTYIKAWQAGERLLHASLREMYNTQ